MSHHADSAAVHVQRDQPPAGTAQLGVWDVVSFIIGMVIGVGIYKTPSLMFSNVPDAWTGLGVWVVGGAVTLVGALCYAELGSTYPRLGGEYTYLTRAYGPGVGFLFGWAQLAVILSGSLGMMAYVFADYAATLRGGGPGTATAYAVLAVTVLSVLHAFGLIFGKGVQNLLTVAKVLGLLGILVAGFGFPAPASAAPAETPSSTSLGFALVLVMLTYGGWNDAVYLTAELRDPRRNIPKALIIGTSAVTAFYLLINAAYLYGLGLDGVRKSSAVAADLFKSAFGEAGTRVIAPLVMVSALGGVNALLLAGPRLYAALGADHALFARLGRWHPRLGVPLTALVVQWAVSVGLIVGVGSPAGQAALDATLAGLGFDPGTWKGQGGFELLLRCTAPVFWAFFLLTGLALFVLRWKDPGIERPFTVPLYPVLPLLFCAACGYMLYSGLDYAGRLGLVGAALLLAGLPLYWASRRRAAGLGRPLPENASEMSDPV
jgi:amino acid transporter